MSSKSFVFFTIVLGVVALGNALTCPSNPPGRKNLDVDKYTGTWYLLLTGRPWHGEQNNIDCILERYDRRADNPFLLNVTWAGRFDGNVWRDDKGIVTMDSLVEPNQWKFYMDGAYFHSTIVATDYETWTLEYACIESAGVMKENYMVRSRTATLSLDTLNTLKTVLEGLGMNPADFVTIRQENCS